MSWLWIGLVVFALTFVVFLGWLGWELFRAPLLDDNMMPYVIEDPDTIDIDAWTTEREGESL